jgi:hypothetical protein
MSSRKEYVPTEEEQKAIDHFNGAEPETIP